MAFGLGCLRNTGKSATYNFQICPSCFTNTKREETQA